MATTEAQVELEDILFSQEADRMVKEAVRQAKMKVPTFRILTVFERLELLPSGELRWVGSVDTAEFIVDIPSGHWKLVNSKIN